MKIFLTTAAVILFGVSVYAGDISIGDQFGRRPCPTPAPCPECPKPLPPLPPKKDINPRYSSGEHLVLSAFLSDAFYTVGRVNGLSKKHSYALAVLGAVVANQALEPDREGKRESMGVTLTAAILAPYLTFNF